MQSAGGVVVFFEIGHERPVSGTVKGVVGLAVLEVADVMEPGADDEATEAGFVGANVGDIGDNRTPVHGAWSVAVLDSLVNLVAGGARVLCTIEDGELFFGSWVWDCVPLLLSEHG